MKPLFISVTIPVLYLSVINVTMAEIGVWVKNKNFVQMHTACVQTWTCSLKEDTLHSADTVVKVTESKFTLGVCNAGDGAIDSCNICAASEPKDRCEWSVVKKNHN